MKQSINEYDFRNAFMALRPDNFSYEGLTALFDALEEYERDVYEGTGKEMELDVIALCVDFSEYTVQELAMTYPNHVPPDSDEMDDVELLDAILNQLREYTTVIPFEAGDQSLAIIQDF